MPWSSARQVLLSRFMWGESEFGCLLCLVYCLSCVVERLVFSV